ncbi:MAG TPA: plasmid pRiA4b ORF-3 family protein [Verrucomicrobiae bacterium]|nr:plasmid pRiA4b ORF-3 family protein [Verrucomicrobiae bacterium]
MIRPARPAPRPRKPSPKNRPPALLYRLRVELMGVVPPVWRSLLVAGDATLGWLHAALQVATGWTNSHLHRFGTPSGDFSDPSFELECGDEGRVRLMDVAPVGGTELEYEYDMGDSWSHRVTVESITGPQGPIARDAECVDGARACPPEDCGGPGGYEDLLEAIADPGHEEHDSMLEWLGGGFDPEAFDRAHVDACLKLLPWPRVTVGQLARVLRKRDGA